VDFSAAQPGSIAINIAIETTARIPVRAWCVIAFPLVLCGLIPVRAVRDPSLRSMDGMLKAYE
jgi:hypothetical protein